MIRMLINVSIALLPPHSDEYVIAFFESQYQFCTLANSTVLFGLSLKGGNFYSHAFNHKYPPDI